MLGTLLANRYRLDSELGQGGMGVVYRAHDTVLDRDVAVKVLSQSGLGTAGRARLLREAQAAAQLNHPNIVGVYDAGETDGLAFIVMELVEGQNLYDRRPQSLDATLAIAQQICAALDHAHSHGLVHRDLKPENVVITPDSTAKLMDFGLARSPVASRLTAEGVILGTVFYLAPEQALGKEVDGRADLYSLGAMLYELATGRLPFDGDDPLAVVTQHLHAPVASPRSIRSDLPAALEALLLKLLAKDPAERFASAREVAAALAQVAHEREFPLSAAPRHNLPIQLTSFVGRERQLAEVKRLLRAPELPGVKEQDGPLTRLVTITGAGGCGKTRLALQVATELLADFPDGIWLVELASVTDPALVPQAMAAVLGVRDEPGYPLAKALADYLRPKAALLILDNCEHLIEACAQLAEALLRACPKVKLLASSREALGIPGETGYPVPSLSSPDPSRLPAVEAVLRYEAVRLFADRAVAVKPDFAVTEANALAVAQICRRLDGVPLAIELAAARVRAMSVEQIAARLDDRFRLLTGGSRTAVPRHQTLRALIDWSWDLLPEAERVLMRRLSVFWGGWALEAAEAVCAEAEERRGTAAPDEDDGRLSSREAVIRPSDVLDLLTRLVDKSLVGVEEQGGETRYQLLETIREYAREKLLQSGEAEAIQDCLLDYFLRLAETAEPELRRANQLIWLARLEMEHDNLHAALKWSWSSGAIEAGLRLAGALSRFWYLHGYWSEGRESLERRLSQDGGTSSSGALSGEAIKRARAKALYGAGWLANEGEPEAAYYQESLNLCREIGDKWGAAFSLRGLGSRAASQGEREQAMLQLDESLALFQEIDDQWGIALVQYNLGWLLSDSDSQRAETIWEECLGLFRQVGDRWGIAVTLGALRYPALLRGHYQRAAALSEESLTLFRELGDKAGIATSLSRLGNVAFRRGDYQQAKVLLEEGLVMQRELGDQGGAVFTLSLLGLVACYQGDYRPAVTSLDQALALGREIEDSIMAAYVQSYLGLVAYYRDDLDRAASLWRDSLIAHREIDEKTGIAFALNGLGLVACRQGDDKVAMDLLEESLTLARASGDKRYVAIALDSLGRVARAQSDASRAAALFTMSLSLRKKMGDKQGIAETLEGTAGVLATRDNGLPEKAARLFAAAQALREMIGAPLPPVERAEYDRDVASARAALGEEGFTAAWAEGRAMTAEQAIAHALQGTLP